MIYPWQQTQWQHVIQRWQNHNLPHALLLTGMPGLGKQSFARCVAKTLLCIQATATGEACDNCRTCQLFNAGSHPDFYSIQPEEQGKTIRVDQIRELIAQISQTAQQGGYKIIVLQPAEAMNPAAANALLKTLEEPMAQTILLLISHQPGLLPATVRSRCQTLLFTPPPRAEAQQWLAIHHKSPADIALVLALAEGSPLQALALLEGTEPYSRTGGNLDLKQRQKLLENLKALSENQADPIQIASNWTKTDPNLIIYGLLSATMDIIRLRGKYRESIVNKDYLDFLQRLACRTTLFKLFAYLDELYERKRQLNISNSLNTQLLIENLFCSWQTYGCTLTHAES